MTLITKGFVIQIPSAIVLVSKFGAKLLFFQVQELTPEYFTSCIRVRTYNKDETVLKEGCRTNCGLKAVISVTFVPLSFTCLH